MGANLIGATFPLALYYALKNKKELQTVEEIFRGQ